MKLCECGCGQPAPLSHRSFTKLGYALGTPQRFCLGHAGRAPSSLWDRFIKSVVLPDDPDGCFVLIKPTINGYTQIHTYDSEHKIKNLSGHRASWGLFCGAIPAGLFVLHHCDNPKCVRPDHLYLGTAKDNYRDAKERNRLNIPKGKHHYCAVLNETDIIDIRRRHNNGETQRTIASD